MQQRMSMTSDGFYPGVKKSFGGTSLPKLGDKNQFNTRRNSFGQEIKHTSSGSGHVVLPNATNNSNANASIPSKPNRRELVNLPEAEGRSNSASTSGGGEGRTDQAKTDTSWLPSANSGWQRQHQSDNDPERSSPNETGKSNFSKTTQGFFKPETTDFKGDVDVEIASSPGDDYNSNQLVGVGLQDLYNSKSNQKPPGVSGTRNVMTNQLLNPDVSTYRNQSSISATVHHRDLRALSTEEEQMLVSDNLRLRQELEALQVSLLQSLKRQDRFISGGQFKGPPAKKSMSQTHMGGFDPKKTTRAEANFQASELKRYKGKANELQKEVQALRKMSDDHKDVRRKVKLLEDENRILKNQVTTIREDQVETYDLMNSNYERQIGELKALLKNYESDDNVKDKLLSQEKERMNREKQDLLDDLEALKEQLRLLQEELEASRKACGDHESANGELQFKLESVTQHEQELADNLERWKKKLADAQKRHRELEQQQSAEKGEQATVYERNIADVRRGYEEQIQGMNREKQEMQDLLEGKRREIESLENQLKAMKQGLEDRTQEWGAETLAIEHRCKLDLRNREAEHKQKLEAVESTLSKKLKDSESAAKFVEKKLKGEIEELKASSEEKVKKLYNMALMQLMQNGQRRGPSLKIIFSLWRAETRNMNLQRREMDAKREGQEQLERKLEEEKERQAKEKKEVEERLKKEIEDKDRRYKQLTKLQSEENKKKSKEEIAEAIKKERLQCQSDGLTMERRYINEIKNLKEKNASLDKMLCDMDEKVVELERAHLQKKLQQVMKLQVLAPRVSVTINGDTVNMVDVEVAPSSEELKEVMTTQVLPRFAKIILSEDFDESKTQVRVQEVMNTMVAVIEDKLQGIFGQNCLRSTTTM